MDGIGADSSDGKEEYLNTGPEKQHTYANAWSKVQKMIFSVQDQMIIIHAKKTVIYHMEYVEGMVNDQKLREAENPGLELVHIDMV